MKVTPFWLSAHLPFLCELVQRARITGKRKIAIDVKTGPVEVYPIANDGMSRYFSGGSIFGNSFVRFAGTLDTAANELEAAPPVDGRSVNQGHFYAVLDIHEYYGVRTITVWMNEEDLKTSNQVLKNQLTPLRLQACS
jgi:hypothetical protein